MDIEKARVLTITMICPYTLDSSKQTKGTAPAPCCTTTNKNTRVNGKTTKNLAKVSIPIPMVAIIKEILKTA